ncbi:T9SS type A sorting domain-containing protein [Hymenobacter edaphi]|uniref:T9SS type A sorting domain-containing protein n=1 Tax=Hymenobacter edaphi TaxID=2211146 RepID=UPI0014020FD2|nr:T9SS type A sorting domain-containing protein [Hymenobacter edaphi]
MQPTRDGGYILGGMSYSPISGDKTQGSQGDSDYWVVKYSASGTKQWDRTFGGSAGDDLRALQQTPDGGYLLGGNSLSPISGDKTQGSQGNADFWVVKIDASGAKQWDKRFGGLGNEQLYAVQNTSDGGYMLGGYSSSNANGDRTQPTQGAADYWVVKLDATGAKQWDKRFGGSDNDVLTTLKPAAGGGYVLGGYSYSPISGDQTQPRRGGSDYWLIKIDAGGNKQWDKRFGGAQYNDMWALQLTSDGGYLLAGNSDSPVGGDKTQAGQGYEDYWVVKLDASGTKQWDKTYGGRDKDMLTAVQQTPDGGYLLGGTSRSWVSGTKTQANQGAEDYWVVKIDANGGQQWDLTLGGNNADNLTDLQQTSDGGYLLGGYSHSGVNADKTQPSLGGQDFWLVKLSGSATTATTAPLAPRHLQLHPNPAQERITLRLADAPRGRLRLRLHDATGRVVLTRSFVHGGAQESVELGPQPAGLYLVRVEGPTGYLATQRLVVE